MGMTEQIDALETGNGIQFLLDSAYRILNNPLLMFDANYNMIAFTDVPVDDPIWNEFTSTGTLLPETFEFLATERITEDIMNTDKTVEIRREEKNYVRMVGHIVSPDNLSVGLLAMYEIGSAFDAGVFEAFEALVDKIVREIRDCDYFTMLAMTYQEDKINLLLDGDVGKPLMFNPQAQILYQELKDYLYVAVVGVERNSVLEHVYRGRLPYYKSMLKTTYPSFKYAVHQNGIVMLMSSKSRYFDSIRFFAANAELFENNGLYMGISDSFENIYELRKYHAQAAAALAEGLAARDGEAAKACQRFFRYGGDRC